MTTPHLDGATSLDSGALPADAGASAEPTRRRLTPVAGVKMQLVAAALMWLIGSSILMVRGVGYMTNSKWHAWVVGIGLVLGVVKSRYMLDRVARKAVARILKRGRACFFGFFSVRSWALVALMMSVGVAIRHTVSPGRVGSGVLGAVYLGIGTALFLADRVFWHAVLQRIRSAKEFS